MKVFIGLSEDAGRAVAGSLSLSVRDVFTDVESWLSPENIEPGRQWWQPESECWRSLPGKETDA